MVGDCGCKWWVGLAWKSSFKIFNSLVIHTAATGAKWIRSRLERATIRPCGQASPSVAAWFLEPGDKGEMSWSFSAYRPESMRFFKCKWATKPKPINFLLFHSIIHNSKNLNIFQNEFSKKARTRGRNFRLTPYLRCQDLCVPGRESTQSVIITAGWNRGIDERGVSSTLPTNGPWLQNGVLTAFRFEIGSKPELFLQRAHFDELGVQIILVIDFGMVQLAMYSKFFDYMGRFRPYSPGDDLKLTGQNGKQRPIISPPPAINHGGDFHTFFGIVRGN